MVITFLWSQVLFMGGNVTVSNEKRFENAYSVQLCVNFTSCPCEQTTCYFQFETIGRCYIHIVFLIKYWSCSICFVPICINQQQQAWFLKKIAASTVKRDKPKNNILTLLSFQTCMKVFYKRRPYNENPTGPDVDISSKYHLLCCTKQGISYRFETTFSSVKTFRRVLSSLRGHMAEASSICTLLRKLCTWGSKLSS